MAHPLYDGKTVAAADLAGLIDIVPNGIVSRPLLDTGPLKQVLFAMDGGQEISEHRAPFVATIHVLAGRLKVRAGDAWHDLAAGQWVLFPANLPHQLVAPEPARFLLTMARS